MKKIQEILKDVKLSADFKGGELTIVSDSPKEGVKKFNMLIDIEEADDYWNTVKIEGQLYDINLWLDGDEQILTIYGLLEGKSSPLKVDTENFMRIPLNGQPTEEETKAFVRENVETVLLQIFSAIPMDKPENFEAIVDFVTEDVVETSDSESGYFSHGDIITGFRRFIEKQ